MIRAGAFRWLAASALVLTAATLGTQARIQPATPGVDPARLAMIDDAVAGAIAEKKLPGAVVLVGRGDTVVYRKAYGNRAVVPAAEPMTVDTIFDMASLTKVVATTTAVMMLVEDGKIRLTDPVAQYIPSFAKYGKDRVTIRHLMTHMSGLRPDVDLADPWVGYEAAINLASEEILSAAPGRQFVYSDIGYFLLAEIVAKVTGQPFDQFVTTRLFKPLGMSDTMFKPPPALRSRIAPTEACTQYGWPCAGPGAEMLRGVVHDPTARRMGGVAGHAGLFSTADDISRFARMLLHGGELGGARVLSPLAVARMTSPSTPEDQPNVRGLGWDLDSSYSANRGELLPIGSFGHTGFTGTSLWVDPATGVYVVFLSNRVHPDGKGDVTPLRARVATIAASAFTTLPSSGLGATRRMFDAQTPAVPA
ncbi:MAG TPA: serine hydrolase domain-containing protein, partial [Vicinamibacterales bacterium]|nr:serine hydrolase domain-containing protein [Vicinamibacterales bacterium]